MPPDSEEDVSPHVRLRIEPEQKKKWLDFIEDSDNYTTLTDLIKTSVSNTIDSKWVLVDGDRDESVPNDLTDSIDEIDSRLDVIETQLDDAVLGDADPSEQRLTEQELMDLARVCHDNLPLVQDAGHLRDLSTHYDIKLSSDIQAKVSGTAQDISAHISEPVDHVRNALIYLERQETANVESVVHEGTRRWFEKDPNADRNIESRLEFEEKVSEDVEFVPGSEIPDNDA